MIRLFKGVIPGRPRVLKNGKRIISRGAGRRAVVLPSSQYSEWERSAAIYLRGAFKSKCIRCPVIASFKFYFKDRRAEPDVSNLISGPEDVMQKVGIIKNDRQIVRVIGEKFFGHEPRTEIELFQYEGLNDG